MKTPHPNCHPERGSGTVVAVSIIAILLTLLTTTLLLAHISIVKERISTAADLAALAASDSARGLMVADPCTLAGQVAQHHEATLDSCELEDDGIARVAVSGTVKMGGSFTLRAESRAGPPPHGQ